MIFFGACPRCGSPIFLPGFSTEPLKPSCPCQAAPDVADAVILGHRFDARVQQMHAHLLSQLSDADMEELAIHLEEELRNLCDGIDDDSPKTILAFLIRLAALARFAAVDCSELKEASSAL